MSARASEWKTLNGNNQFNRKHSTIKWNRLCQLIWKSSSTPINYRVIIWWYILHISFACAVDFRFLELLTFQSLTPIISQQITSPLLHEKSHLLCTPELHPVWAIRVKLREIKTKHGIISCRVRGKFCNENSSNVWTVPQFSKRWHLLRTNNSRSRNKYKKNAKIRVEKISNFLCT